MALPECAHMYMIIALINLVFLGHIMSRNFYTALISFVIFLAEELLPQLHI